MGLWGIIGIISSVITIGGFIWSCARYRKKRRREKTVTDKLNSIDTKTSEHSEHHSAEIALRQREIEEAAERRRKSIQPRIILNEYKQAPQFRPAGEPNRIIFYIENQGHLAFIERIEVQTAGFVLRTNLGEGRALERNEDTLELIVDYLHNDDAHSHILSIVLYYRDEDGNHYEIHLSGQREEYKLGTPSPLQ